MAALQSNYGGNTSKSKNKKYLSYQIFSMPKFVFNIGHWSREKGENK